MCKARLLAMGMSTEMTAGVVTALFVAEGDDWVYAGGAGGRDGAGGDGYAEEDRRNCERTWASRWGLHRRAANSSGG